MHQTLIPRTQRLDTRQCQPMHPDQFAAILIEKLESVKREQDSLELLDKKLKEVIINYFVNKLYRTEVFEVCCIREAAIPKF